RIAVRVDTAERAGRVTIALDVADTGPGIDPKDHERIFERFVRGDATPSLPADGTGLGLAITRSLVDLMGGTLRLESTPGKGATFKIELSLPPAPASAGDRCAAE
ncbi:MAG TPA: ATP-binding protein, partial [Thermohalobaculum sp.]|nr:ATP-binding protein [Thermohalobaculum sp.]